jgi:flagellar protein FlaI
MDAKETISEEPAAANPPVAAQNKKLVESYDIDPGYSKIEIWLDEHAHEYLYKVVEPALDERERYVLNFARETMITTTRVDMEKIGNREEYLRRVFNALLHEYDLSIPDPDKLFYHLKRDFLGYGRIGALMADPLLEDISCDGPGVPIYVYHKNYENIRTSVVFDELELDSFVIKLAQKCGKHLSVADPLLDASFPDGSRLQSTYSKEVTAAGSSFTIRKFRKEPFSPLDLIRYGTIDSKVAAFYWLIVENGKNMVFAGGTASGKTTALNSVSLFIPPNSKIVSIEDTREISLPHENWLKAITRSGFGGETAGGKKMGEIDMYELLKAALRQRPEYILVGEVRGIEASVAFQAMATGHVVYMTMHAESTPAVIHRLESEPINIPRIIIQALDVVSVQALLSIGGKKQRKIKEITEIIGVEPGTKEVLINNVFRYNEDKNAYVYSGRSYVLEKIAKTKGVSIADIENEWKNRERVMAWMMKKDLKNYVDFTNVIVRYYKDRPSVLKEALAETKT